MIPMSSNVKIFNQRLEVLCDADCLERIRNFVRDQAKASGFDSLEVGRLVLAVDEASSNIIKHTYRFAQDRKIAVEWRDQADRVEIGLQDDSPEPYLPSHSDFDLDSKIRYRHANGYGKYLIEKAVDDLHYETIPGSHNQLSLIKFKPNANPPSSSASKAEKKAPNPFDVAMSRSLTLRNLLGLGESLSRQKDSQDVTRLFLYSVMGSLTSRPVALLQLQDGKGLKLAGQIGLSSRLSPVSFSNAGEFSKVLRTQNAPILVSDIAPLIPEEEKKKLEDLQAAVLVPLIVGARLLGALVIGPKKNQQPFTEEDMNLVTLLGNYALLIMGTLGPSRGSADWGHSGSELRAALLWAMARVNELSRDHETSLVLEDEGVRPHLEIDDDLLQKILLTMITHIVYLADEGGKITLRLGTDAGEGVLHLLYQGTPIGFEKGKPGHNPLIDQLITGGVKLSDCPKNMESTGGKISVTSKLDKKESGMSETQVDVALRFRLMKH